MSKLTVKQESAIQNFLINGGNKTAAYKSAYSTSNMKDKTVNEKASRFFTGDKIRARLEELQKQIEEENKISKNKIVQELTKISLYDIRNLFEDDDLKSPSKLTEIDGKVISSIKSTTRYTKDGSKETILEYKLNGKNQSIEQINKMLGYNEPDKSETVVSETNKLPSWYKKHD